MQIKELGSVIKYIDHSYQENDLLGKYSELVTILNQTREAPSEEVSTQLKQKTKELQNIQRKIHPQGWSYLKEKIFIELGTSKFIGIGAAEQLKHIFRSNMGDTHSITQSVSALREEMNQFKQRVDSLKSNLGQLAEDGEEEIDPGNGVLQLVFENEVALETIEDIQKYAEVWNDIMRGFSRAVGDSAKPAIVKQISKASPTFMLIEGSLNTLKIMGVAAASILSLILLKYQIEKAQLEVEALKGAKNKEGIIDGFKKWGESELESGLKNVTEETLEKAKSLNSKKPAGDDIEDFRRAVKHMFEFMIAGGKVDVASNESQESGESVVPKIGFGFKLSASYRKVEELEASVGEKRKLLEPSIPKVENVETDVIDENTEEKAD